MQRSILIPELACIVRKDADNGCNIAYHSRNLPAAQQNYNNLLSGYITEHQLFWDKPGQCGHPNITTAQEST